MKQFTNTFIMADPKKHSIVFKPSGDDENVIASSIYVMNGVIPAGARECKITISWPDDDSGTDSDYNAITTT